MARAGVGRAAPATRYTGSVKASTAAVSISLIVSLCGCLTHPQTDKRLIAGFEANRDLFDKLASLSHSPDTACPHENDPAICVPDGSDPILEKLKRKTRFSDAQVYVKSGPPRTLWIPVETIGVLSTSTNVMGFVYSPSELNPLVGNVCEDVEDRLAYRRIAQNWYLFAAN